jgi:tRNA dimethylallyltransferase
MTNAKPKVVVLTGPTASGKSSLAIELALHFGGEIFNADSMQVYRGMDVGTAKPSIAERRGIPHHLLDVVDPDQRFNAAMYRSLAIPLLRDCAARKRLCLVVGGTGLYLKSLLGGLLECPLPDPTLRDALRQECETVGTLSLHKRLEELDPESAVKIHMNDKVRIIRALEIIQVTGRPLSSLIQEHGFRDRPFKTLKISLDTEREWLYRRINQRSVEMIEAGLVNETKVLLSKGYSPELKPMKALGYRHMVSHLKGAWSLDEATRQLQSDTRRYAKRQITWFRSDPEMVWVKKEEGNTLTERIREFMRDTP